MPGLVGPVVPPFAARCFPSDEYARAYDVPRMGHRMFASAGNRVPKSDRLVPAARSELTAIRTKGNVPYLMIVA